MAIANKVPIECKYGEFMPTPDQIAAACEIIRSEWSNAEYARRAGAMRDLFVAEARFAKRRGGFICQVSAGGGQ